MEENNNQHLHKPHSRLRGLQGWSLRKYVRNNEYCFWTILSESWRENMPQLDPWTLLTPIPKPGKDIIRKPSASFSHKHTLKHAEVLANQSKNISYHIRMERGLPPNESWFNILKSINYKIKLLEFPLRHIRNKSN